MIGDCLSVTFPQPLRLPHCQPESRDGLENIDDCGCPSNYRRYRGFIPLPFVIGPKEFGFFCESRSNTDFFGRNRCGFLSANDPLFLLGGRRGSHPWSALPNRPTVTEAVPNAILRQLQPNLPSLHSPATKTTADEERSKKSALFPSMKAAAAEARNEPHTKKKISDRRKTANQISRRRRTINDGRGAVAQINLRWRIINEFNQWPSQIKNHKRKIPFSMIYEESEALWKEPLLGQEIWQWKIGPYAGDFPNSLVSCRPDVSRTIVQIIQWQAIAKGRFLYGAFSVWQFQTYVGPIGRSARALLDVSPLNAAST